MALPKIYFINIPLPIEVDCIHGFLFKNKWGWGKYITKKHPKIEKVYSINEEKNQVEFLKKYIVNYKKSNKTIIIANKKKYQKAWDKIEKDYFELLQQIMSTEWPKNKEKIKAMISINPICPRFLNDWSFSIFYKYKKVEDAIEVIMHECCHFLYFKKWKEVFPNAKSKTFECPYIEWHLSEILAPVILNDLRIQKLLKKKADFYDEYKKIYIGKKNLPKYFKLLYKKHTKQHSNFDDFLRKAYLEIKNHRDKFKNV
ncbi:hypothetical protein KAT95_02600 [Candidatus Parcubacteria bacterium]|nr:hypothetical protein [Candidatus Parcubacteria bacterium]